MAPHSGGRLQQIAGWTHGRIPGSGQLQNFHRRWQPGRPGARIVCLGCPCTGRMKSHTWPWCLRRT